MDQDRGRDPEDERGEPPEGVRIIGAEEAAEALERPDVAQRRRGGQLRYGDRPPGPPAHGPRPVLRFPLGSSDDPAEVERPPVAPSSPPSEPIELPHWTEPPTGQVPAAITGEQPVADDPLDDADEWADFAPAPRWRDESSRGDDDVEDVRIFGDDSMRIGALDESERISHDDYLSFADLDEHVTPGRSVFADLPEEDDARLWEPEPFDPEPFDPEPRRPEVMEPDPYERQPDERGGYGRDLYGTEQDPDAYESGEAGTYEPDPYESGGAGTHDPDPYESGGASVYEPDPYESGGAGTDEADPYEPGEPGGYEGGPYDPGGAGAAEREPDEAEVAAWALEPDDAEPGEDRWAEQFEDFQPTGGSQRFEDHDPAYDDVSSDDTRAGAIWDDEVHGDERERSDEVFIPDDRREGRRRRPPADEPRRARRSGSGGSGSDGTDAGDRDIGMAVVVGVALLGLALLLFNIGPSAAMILVTAVVGFAAAELFTVLRRAGYQPVNVVGIFGTVGLAIAAYNYGTPAIPIVLFLITVVCLLWYLVGASTESPTLNVGVTLGGVLWVGLLGSFAALLLSPQAGPALIGAVDGVPDDPGVGILLAAIFGTVGYDVGGLFVGRNAGRVPLSSVSPNKTREGLIGGMVVAWVVVVVGATLVGWGPVDSLGEGALVGLAVAIAAPLGDLVESLVKRDLAVKDMGSILPGHGGMLDRFDAMLFVLPTVYVVGSVSNFFI